MCPGTAPAGVVPAIALAHEASDAYNTSGEGTTPCGDWLTTETPVHPLRLACPLAIVAVALSGCGEGDIETYRGRAFDVGKPSAGWTLVADPWHFTLAEPPADDLARAKVVELLNRELSASVEIFLVDGGASEAEQVMKAVRRQDQRRGLVESKPRLVAVGNREGLASIAMWQQTKASPKQCFYCVRVPLGGALWCLVGNASQERFRAAVKEFQAILETVTFHRY